MKIVADESIDKQIVDRLRSDGHDVVFIAELDPGIEDEAVLLRSRESNSVLLTADKDFGETRLPSASPSLRNRAHPLGGP